MAINGENARALILANLKKEEKIVRSLELPKNQLYPGFSYNSNVPEKVTVMSI